LLLFPITCAACDTRETGVVTPAPEGPAPVVSIDLAFGKAPVRGFLRIVPPPGSKSWKWRIEELGGDPGGLVGIVDRPVAVPYEYEDPGAHEILVQLTGPEGTRVVKEWVVVDDPTGYQVIVSRPIEEILGNGSPEGIAVNPDGFSIYVSDFRDGEIAQLDSRTFATLKTVNVTPSAEGLDITPSGSRLLVAHKNGHVTVLRLPELVIETELDRMAGFFIEALDESTFLSAGQIPLVLVDWMDGRTLAQTDRDAWHFAVSSDGARAAALELPDFAGPGLPNTRPPSLWIHALPSLSVIEHIVFDELFDADQIAWDPDGIHLYVLGENLERESQMLIVDSATGAITSSFGVEVPVCGWCVANPVTSFGNGRYIAFERWSSVLVVDTEIDRPRYLFGGPPIHGFQPAGVAATEGSYELYVLGGPDRSVYRLHFVEPAVDLSLSMVPTVVPALAGAPWR
jgi:hypothetical protein